MTTFTKLQISLDEIVFFLAVATMIAAGAVASAVL